MSRQNEQIREVIDEFRQKLKEIVGDVSNMGIVLGITFDEGERSMVLIEGDAPMIARSSAHLHNKLAQILPMPLLIIGGLRVRFMGEECSEGSQETDLFDSEKPITGETPKVPDNVIEFIKGIQGQG